MASQVAVSAGNGQTATVNTAVANAPAVLVTDQSGNPVSGTAVTFTVTGGGGSVAGGASAIVSTGSNGIAAPANWVLGTIAGSNTLSATASGLAGSPVSFTATGVAGAATQLATVTAASSSVQSGVAFPQQPAVRLLDVFGNAVAQAGVPVAVAVQSGGATLSGTTPVNTASTGIATYSGLALTGPAGAHTLVYSSAGLTSLVSGSITVTAGGSTTGITQVNPSATVVGESYTVSVSVTGAGGTPTGSVSVSDGSASCNATLTGGSGSCALASTSAGSKTLTATYGGDANFLGSSGTTSHVVGQASTTTTVTGSAPNPSTVGSPYTVNFAVAVAAPGAGAPSGNVTVTDGLGGSCTTGAGAGSCQLTPTSVGTGSLVAVYAGDANLLGSTSAAVGHTVNAIATTTTITGVTPGTIVLGQQVTVSFSVSGGATGTVSVSDGTAGCSASVATGSCSYTPTSAGAKTLTASYPGDATHGSSSDTDALQVDPFGVATQLQFLVQPSTVLVGDKISPAVEVRILDAFGNLVSTATDAITIIIGTNPGGGTLGGSVTVSASGGIASFGDLTIDAAGIGYTLDASAIGLSGATSTAFDVQ